MSKPDPGKTVILTTLRYSFHHRLDGVMKRVPVSSSALRSVGYDERTWTLEVEFNSGEVYQYLDVDPDDVEALLVAESMGAYLNEHIKPEYRHVHVGRS